MIILRPLVVPFNKRFGRIIEYPDDDASPHITRVAVDFLRNHGLGALSWQAKSLKSNIVANCAHLGCHKFQDVRCNNFQQLGRI